MTLKTRNFILYSLFALTSICLILYVVLLLGIDFQSKKLVNEVKVAQGHYLGVSWKISSNLVAMNVLSAGLSVATAWFGAFFFVRIFRLVSSPQLFFIILFWICLGAGILRMINIAAIVGGQDIGLRIALSRTDIAFRLLGMLSIFAASLHTVGIKSQHQSIILASIVTIAFSLSYLFSLNITNPEQNLLFGTTGMANADVFALVTGVFALLNYIKTALNSMDSADWIIVIPLVFLVSGQQIQYASGEWWMVIVSWTLILVGSLWLIRRYMSNYLWY